MKPASSLNALRLIPAEGARDPAGMIVSRRDAARMVGRLAKRAQHYSALRVTAFRDRLVFWSIADEVRLPWFDEGAVYLTHVDKTMFFPVDKRPDVPAKWIEAITARLTAAKGLSRPLLLWPSQDRLTAIGLGVNSCRFPAVDWEGIARP
jgi:hypothetical protein